MAEANSINANTTGIVGNTGTAFTGTAVTQYNVITGASTSSTLNNVAPSATSGVPLISQGSSAQPIFGTAVVAGGGTGATSLTGVVLGNGTSAMTALTYTAPTTYTPVLSFGGGTTGITYSTQTGNYQQIGNLVFVAISIVLTSKGSSTGNASITMPVTPNSGYSQYLNIKLQNTSFGAGNTYCLFLNPNKLIQAIQTATTVINLADTNFTNTSTVDITGCYLI